MKWTAARRIGSEAERPSPDPMLKILGWVLIAIVLVAVLVGLLVFGAIEHFI
jgi:hypothetical protein